MIAPEIVALIMLWFICACICLYFMVEGAKIVTRFDVTTAVTISCIAGILGCIVIVLMWFFDKIEPKNTDNWWNKIVYKRN